jgi:hypothetical protein
LFSIVNPDYSNLFELENERASIVSTYRILSSHAPLLKCLVPKYLLNDQALERKIQELDFLIDVELTKPTNMSRNAFIAVNSLSNVLRIQKIIE